MARRGGRLGLRVAVANVLPWNNGWPGAEAPIRELNAQIATLGAGAALSRDAGGPEAAGPDARGVWTSDGDHPSVEGYRRLGELAFRLP